MDDRVLRLDLSRPEALPESGPTVETRETHLSVVHLTGARAYKRKKPVSIWGFVDYTTPAKRRVCCEEEVRLGRRFAPDVYLGVLPVVRDASGRHRVGGPGEVVDHVVAMRRVPDEETLEGAMSAGRATAADVVELARTLAAGHAAAAHGPEIAAAGSPDVFERIVAANLAQSREGAGTVVPTALLDRFAARFLRRLRDTRPLLDRRAREGRLLEGHGDLRCEHVVRTGAGDGRGRTWGAIDGIEFSLAMRAIDPISDVAFLATDLRARGRRDLASAFVVAYLAARPDPDAQALLPLYLAHRGHVRTVVAVRRLADGSLSAADRAEARRDAVRRLVLATAAAHAGDRARLLVVTGVPGSGKSVLARELGALLDADVLGSDGVRKGLAGLPPTARTAGAARDALYGEAMSRRTYEALLVAARPTLAAGGTVVLDATYLHRAERDATAALAAEVGASRVLVGCEAPFDVLRARIAARAARDDDPSDATAEVAARLLATREPVAPEEGGIVVSSEEDPVDALARVADATFPSSG